MGSHATLEIDVIRLYSGTLQGFHDEPGMTAHQKWNRWLTDCQQKMKMNELNNARIGLQMGMASAQKKGMVTEDLAAQFARWIGSIEKTMRKINKSYRRLENDQIGVKGTAKSLHHKRMSDVEFEAWLRGTSY